MYNHFLSVVLTLFCLSSIKSQMDCSKRLEVIKSQLEAKKVLHESILFEMSKSLDTCLTNDGISYYIRGLMELRKKNGKESQRSITNFKTASELGYTRAKTYLGYAYKNGWGVPRDLKKSLTWIRLAAEDGDDNAIYTLGYYYLKGMGGLEPDYKKAVYYFERSSHQMAKYWLAFCKNFGLGSIQDEVDAQRILIDNGTPESRRFVEFMDSNILANLQYFERPQKLAPQNLNTKKANSQFQGYWIEKDWKNELVFRQIPLAIKMESIDQGDINLIINIENHEYPLHLDQWGKLKKASQLMLSAPFRGPDHPENLTYIIKDIAVFRDLENETLQLECSTWIDDYNEEGPPISIQIYGPETIDKRIDKSFYVYPNSFSQVLNYSFTIEFPSQVNLEIFDLTGNRVNRLDFKTMEPGPQLLEINCDDLRPQNYVAVLEINGSKFTRQVIKKY